jgi:hypothetical protein
METDGELVRCVKKSPPGDSFRTPAAPEGDRGTPYRPCREAAVPKKSSGLV